MIRCPHCGSPESSIRSMEPKPDHGGTVRRYRHCKKCHKSFTTHEVLAVYAGSAKGMIIDTPEFLEADE